ncbi:hypothetical protein ACFQRB_20485 [Halobaculum litoreum]|uniref:Lycopene cyclase domain-containing protein n=1 Tax=Halobaculum litoreum TaxID=3031998 RepID=A0ABD5XYM9_9EURY
MVPAEVLIFNYGVPSVFTVGIVAWILMMRTRGISRSVTLAAGVATAVLIITHVFVVLLLYGELEFITGPQGAFGQRDTTSEILAVLSIQCLNLFAIAGVLYEGRQKLL